MVASGRGTLVITSYGGLFRLILEKGEKYQVSKRHLVAWDANMSPEPVKDAGSEYDQALLAKAASAARSGFEWLIKKPVRPNSHLHPAGGSFVWVVQDISSIRLLFLETPTTLGLSLLGCAVFLCFPQEMCELKGPGDFYLASRLEPDFEVSRNAIRKVKQYIRVPGPNNDGSGTATRVKGAGTGASTGPGREAGDAVDAEFVAATDEPASPVVKAPKKAEDTKRAPAPLPLSVKKPKPKTKAGEAAPEEPKKE